MPNLHRSSAARRGMTLLEIMVVVTIMAVLTTLVVVYVIPSFQDNKNVIRAVDRVSTALLIAKGRALRDQAPRGIRFTVGAVTVPNLASSASLVPQLEYIEQPDPFTGGSMTLPAVPAVQPRPQFIRFQQGSVDFIGGADLGVTTEYQVQPGDYFRVAGINYQIQNIIQNNRVTQLQLKTTLVSTINLNPTAYQVIRQTRIISGENPVVLPTNVMVDLSIGQIPNMAFPTNSAAGNFEILFDPSGAVMNSGGSAPIVFAVRDVTADNSLEPNTIRLLTIYPRTGKISANPIGPPTNPLQYALDGNSSGL